MAIEKMVYSMKIAMYTLDIDQHYVRPLLLCAHLNLLIIEFKMSEESCYATPSTLSLWPLSVDHSLSPFRAAERARRTAIDYDLRREGREAEKRVCGAGFLTHSELDNSRRLCLSSSLYIVPHVVADAA